MKTKKDNQKDINSKTKKSSFKQKITKAYKPDHLDLEEWQRLLRKQYAEKQGFTIKNIGKHPVFSEFHITNPETNKTYRVAVRGLDHGLNYCSCPDYSINNLGTCKHIEFVLFTLLRKPGAKKAFREGFVQPYSEIFLKYDLQRDIIFKAGKDAPKELLTYIKGFFNAQGVLEKEHLLDFHSILTNMPAGNHEVRCYDDVLAFVAEHQDLAHRKTIFKKYLSSNKRSFFTDSLLKTNLYPYQVDGALFAVEAGRCIIGDDMGLGKTLQALAAAEIMAQIYGIQKTLIISPTSLKYQWKNEIERFTDRSVEVIDGFIERRKSLYSSDSFYKLINYELVYKDLKMIGNWAPDLIILDEAQRIKNWKTRTARSVKQLQSTFAIVLTGTPIENKLEELHSILEFIDRYRLGPLYRFIHDHTIKDEGSSGKIVGYKGLESIRAALKDVLIRRRKEEVLKQLPDRIDKNFCVPMTKEQRAIHDDYYDMVVKIVAKWRRYKFLCEADQRRLLIALNMMRMAADNTYLVDRKTIHGPKIEELEILLRELVIEGGEKAVIFSQWIRMNELVEQTLERNKIGYVHLNGSIPSRERKMLLDRFRGDPECKVFLSTDAGGVGLNLQSGSVVINMDIPWNPAVLEQRIGRAHRLGQTKNVRVINFITSGSIEERILDLLRFKKSLIVGALDADGGDTVVLGESQLKRFMQSVETISEPYTEASSASEQELDERFENEKELSNTEDTIPSLEEDCHTKLPNSNDILGGLLMKGAQFLMDVSKTISGSSSSEQTLTSGLLCKDEVTGGAYIKLPLPEPQVLNGLLSALGDFVKGLQRGEDPQG